jgi:hypothetical protein
VAGRLTRMLLPPLVLVVLLLWGAKPTRIAEAQTGGPITVREAVTGKAVSPGDAANNALRVNVVTGGTLPAAGTIYAGTLAATTTAAAIAGSQTITKVLVQSDPDNTEQVLCGNAATQVIQLGPGDGVSVEINNLNLVYCKTVAGTGTVAYFAR